MPLAPSLLRNIRVFSVTPEGGGIEAGGCQLLRLALHRHFNHQNGFDLHRHDYHQILFYLRGGGKIRTGTDVHEISAGTGLLIPRGYDHRFIRHSRRNPLCLVMDFSCAEDFPLTMQRPGIFRLSLLRKLVNEIAHFKECRSIPDRLQRDGIAVQLLGLCLGMVLQSEVTSAKHPTNLLLQMENLIQQSGNAKLTLSEAAEKSGYQQDYLNRILKEQSGMTFGQLRSQLRLRQSQAALKQYKSVGQAAEASGFDDVNYFIRWFRKQTGRTPGSHLRAESLSDSV